MQRRPNRNPETAYRAVGDEGGLVVLPTQSEVKVLNPVGSFIYAMLDGEHTVQQIVDRVVDEFDVTPDQALADTDEFLDSLEAEGMLAAVEGASS